MELRALENPSAMFQSMLRLIRIGWQGWERFWFSPADPTTLGLMRWLVGGMLVYTHFVWGLQLESFFGSTGFHPPDVVSYIGGDRLMPSFWWLVPDSHLMLAHCVCMAILVMFWVGFATRVTSVLSMLITISYAYRAHMANFGLDQINSILCLYLCIGPSGAVLSVDNYLRRKWRGVKRPPQKSVSANLAVRLIQIHFCIIYIFAGLSKLQGNAWWNGEAVWMAFANLEYQSMDMTWVAWYPWLSDVMTHTTILWEVSFAALIWVPALRPFILLIGFALHFGIGAAMGMWTFGFIMIFGHISFWPDSLVRQVVGLLTLQGAQFAEETPAAVAADRPHGPEEKSAAQKPPAAATRAPVSDQQPVAAPVAPALVLIDGLQSRRLKILNYFRNRGYRCLPAASASEGSAVCQSVSADAVLVVGSNIPDKEIAALQDAHAERANEQLFLVLTQSQSQRLSKAADPSTHVIDCGLAIGALRSRIEETLARAVAESN